MTACPLSCPVSILGRARVLVVPPVMRAYWARRGGTQVMSDGPDEIGAAIARFERASVADRLASATRQAEHIRSAFPLAEWSELTLARYALGPPDSKSSFCYALEFGSRELGSISGGSSRKLIMYARNDGSGYFFDPAYDNPEQAWQALRSGYLEAFDLTRKGRTVEVDEIPALRSGPALTAKTMYVYFPDQLLPIYSQAHLRHFLQRLTGDAASGLPPLTANRRLLDWVRARPELAGWHPIEVMHLLYQWDDPKSAPAVVKIAPGEGARLWPDCRAGGFICVGWDEVGDLAEFASEEEFRTAFAKHFPYNGHQAAVTAKAREVWRLGQLQPGDLVVANEGQSKVLAVGTVVAPGYLWRPERAEFKHTVTVAWDESYARTLAEPVKRWAVTTVADIPGTLWRKIIGPVTAAAEPRDTTSGGAPRGDAELPRTAADPQLQAVADALGRKGQVVLFGPPGTGKTYTALRFALWWLAGDRCDVDPLIEYGSAAFRQAVASLSVADQHAAAWWMVANPAEWSWQRMFADGQVTFRAGRIAKNYTRIRPGDAVFCYEASPVRRIVGFAKVTDVDQHRVEPVGLRAVRSVANGPSWAEIIQDPQLADSEPVTNRSQGTLFALTGRQAARLLEMTGVQDETMSAALENGGQVGQLTQVTFHPSYGYEDFIEGFKPVAAPGGGLNLRLVDGIFKRVCRAASADANRRYLVFIDEINRGNIPKILGELITLLEVDKRGLAVRLPQSGESFMVPPNVYLLGTMNTADRSIRLLDAALRRRFAFLELAPDTEVLEGAYVGKLHLAELLTGLNARICAQLGRERQVGHAFLMRDGQPVTSEEDFAAVIRAEVVPLLQEYGYDDSAMLGRLLGRQAVDETRQSLRELTDMDLVDALYTEFQAAAIDTPAP